MDLIDFQIINFFKKMFTGKKSECEKYSLTTTAEFSTSEEESVSIPSSSEDKSS